MRRTVKSQRHFARKILCFFPLIIRILISYLVLHLEIFLFQMIPITSLFFRHITDQFHNGCFKLTGSINTFYPHAPKARMYQEMPFYISNDQPAGCFQGGLHSFLKLTYLQKHFCSPFLSLHSCACCPQC